VAEIVQIVAIFPGGDLHAGRRAVADQVQPFQVIGGDRLLEPDHAQAGEHVRQGQGLLARVGAVGVHEKLGVLADGVAGGPHPLGIPRGLTADFHFDARNALLRPAAELLLKLSERV
jgi:hypothetical protein